MNADMDRALSMFSALGLGQSDSLSVVTIPGAPWSKSRPRFGRGRAYTKKEDIDAETRTATYLKSVVKRPLEGNAGLVCIFYRPNRQRIDTDNLIKHVCDAGNGVLWLDDSQCTAVMGVIELDAENPRTVVAIGEHTSTLRRGSDATKPCKVCGGPIRLDGHSGNAPLTCAGPCRATYKGYSDLSALVPCGHCGKKFRRQTKTNKFCSVDCRIDSLRDKRRAGAKPFSRCTDCDKELAHKRGGRCRDCWSASRPAKLRKAAGE